MTRGLRQRWPTMIGPFLVLGGWEVASRAEIIRPAFYPPPTLIVMRSVRLFDADVGLGSDLAATVTRLVLTAVGAAAVGILVGLAMSARRWLQDGIEPVLAFFYPIPAILFFPFITFVLGRGETAIVLTSMITPIIIMAISTAVGVRQIDPTLIEAARNYGARGWRFFGRVLLPGALTSIVAGFRVALGISLITVVAVEMIGAGEGLGNVLWTNWTILRVTDMYVALLGIAMLGLMGSVGFGAIANRLLPWQRQVTR